MAKKTTGKSIVAWEQQFEQFAKENTANVKTSDGKFISFGGGRMSFGGADIPDDEIRCVVVGWVYNNNFYDPDVRFDPKNPQAPICYAFGDDEDEMVPHEAALTPQCGSCAACPHNEFGSAQVGQGKACKNTFRLALIAESDLDNIDEAEVVYASIPPKSLKNWSTYLTKVLRDKLKRPHWAVVTTMKRVPDDESQFRVTFTHEENIEDDDMFEPLKKLWEETMATIGFAYPVYESREAPAKRGGGKPAKAQKFARK